MMPKKYGSLILLPEFLTHNSVQNPHEELNKSKYLKLKMFCEVYLKPAKSELKLRIIIIVINKKDLLV